MKEGSASGVNRFGASCAFTFVAARRLAHHPSDGFVDRLLGLGFPPPYYPSYRALASTLVSFVLTECTSFRWTHVGSRTGAMLRRFSLSVAPRFLWECLTSQTVSSFPVPASSNPSCRFPAMGLPACFVSGVMGPLRLVGLSRVARIGEAGTRGRVLASRRAILYSTGSIRSLVATGHASSAAESSFPPSLG